MCVCVCVCVRASIIRCTGGGAAIAWFSSVSVLEILLCFLICFFICFFLFCHQQSNKWCEEPVFHFRFSRTINLTVQTASSLFSARSLRRCCSGLCMHSCRFSLHCIFCGLFYDDAFYFSPSREVQMRRHTELWLWGEHLQNSSRTYFASILFL